MPPGRPPQSWARSTLAESAPCPVPRGHVTGKTQSARKPRGGCRKEALRFSGRSCCAWRGWVRAPGSALLSRPWSIAARTCPSTRGPGPWRTVGRPPARVVRGRVMTEAAPGDSTPASPSQLCLGSATDPVCAAQPGNAPGLIAGGSAERAGVGRAWAVRAEPVGIPPRAWKGSHC